MYGALSAPVERFISRLTPILVAVGERSKSGVPRDRLENDVAVEASNLVAAFLDADGRQSDDELWAYIWAFGPRFDTNLRKATPEDVRKAGLVTGKVVWTSKPSPLFEVLLAGDRTAGTSDARTYYDEAMQLAHTVVSLDAYPSALELSVLERLRSTLLEAIGQAGTPQVGTATGDGKPAATGAAAADEKPLPPARPIDELLAELDGLVGLHGVKKEVKLVTALLRVQKLREERGMPVPDASRHLVFTGNPGTGKTTVARLLAQIYRTLGVVAKGHLVESDRSQLVAGYVGQTAIRVRETFDKADEGVLLIDEAYALARGGESDFGREAVDTLVKFIEDRRDRVVVIVAGYPAEMADFIDSNPGLRSRFPRTIDFPDYSTDELVEILDDLAERNAYRLTDGARRVVRQFFAAQERGKGFGNARLARNLFEAAIARQAQRLVRRDTHSDADLATLTAADITE